MLPLLSCVHSLKLWLDLRNSLDWRKGDRIRAKTQIAELQKKNDDSCLMIPEKFWAHIIKQLNWTKRSKFEQLP